MQCQIQHGDFKPNLHVSGFLNLKELLAPQWQKKDLEKQVLSEWKKLVGTNEVNARFRYVQLCRSLRTYGMTCFKVKVNEPVGIFSRQQGATSWKEETDRLLVGVYKRLNRSNGIRIQSEYCRTCCL
jgi:hypothetical protein